MRMMDVAFLATLAAAALGAAGGRRLPVGAQETSLGPIWPQKGYDATHHARSPFHGPHSAPFIAGEWASTTGQAFSDYPVITEDGTIVAVDDDGTVFCVNFENGEPQVTCNVVSNDPGKPRGSPALIGHQIIAPLPNGQLDIIDARTGQRVSQFNIPDAPAGATGDIVVPSISSDVEVILTWVGNVVFMFIWPDGGQPSLPAWTFNQATGNINGLAVGQAANSEPVAYATSSDGNVYAIEFTNGNLVWPKPCSLGVDITEAPAISRDGLYVFLSIQDHGLYKIDATTGTIVWNRPDLDITGAASFVIGQDGNLMAGDNLGNFYSFSPDTGDQTWAQPFKAAEAITAPAVVDGGAYVYFTDRGGSAYCLDATTGQMEWKLSTNATALGGIAINIDHDLYAVAADGKFVRIMGNQPRIILPRHNIHSEAQWAQRGGTPQHSGLSRFMGPSGITDGGQLEMSWTFKTEGEVVVGAVAAQDGTIIIPDDLGNVYALNPATGAKKWQFSLQTGFVSGEAAIDPGSKLVFIATSEGKLIAVSLESGKVAWQSTLPAPLLGSITVTIDNRIYVSCEDKMMYGFEGEQGRQVLAVSTGSTEDDFAPAILYDDATILVGSEDGFVRSYDHVTQGLRWRYQTHGPVLDVPCVQSTLGNIFVGAANELIALDPNFGDRIWEQPSLSVAGNSPGCGNKHGLLYIGGTDQALHAVEEATGTERWTFKVQDSIYANAVLDSEQETLYITCMDGYVYALDAATGNLVWSKFIAKLLRGDPIILDGGTLVITSEEADAVYLLAAAKPSPSPIPNPSDNPGGDAGVVIAVLLVVGVFGYVGGGFGYSYVRTGEVKHVHSAFWGRVGGRISSAWQSCVQSTFRRSVPTGYGASAPISSSSFPTSSSAVGGSSSGSGGGGGVGSGFQSAASQPPTGTGGGGASAVGQGGGYGAL